MCPNRAERDHEVIKSLSESLHNVRNPLCRVKKRFPRYVIITCCTGALSFCVALALLHAGMGPLLSLVLSACVSGLFSYIAMELWAFPHREGKGRLSWHRLAGNALVGIGGFAGRYLVLTLALRHINLPYPFDNAVPLALAYLTSFIIGYTLRCAVVFKK